MGAAHTYIFAIDHGLNSFPSSDVSYTTCQWIPWKFALKRS